MSQIPSETINIRLINNLIQVIRSLSSEEQMILKSKLLGVPETSESENTAKQSVIDIFNEAPRQQLFKTAEEVDCYLQQERTAWDNTGCTLFLTNDAGLRSVPGLSVVVLQDVLNAEARYSSTQAETYRDFKLSSAR